MNFYSRLSDIDRHSLSEALSMGRTYIHFYLKDGNHPGAIRNAEVCIKRLTDTADGAEQFAADLRASAARLRDSLDERIAANEAAS